jgi:hypothetical protein
MNTYLDASVPSPSRSSGRAGGFDEKVPARCQLEPVPGDGLLGHERAAALLRVKQPLLAQDIDGLANRDARDLEFALELDQGRDFLPRKPLLCFDPPPHDGSDLDVQGYTASVVNPR